MIQSHEIPQEHTEINIHEIRQLHTDGVFYTGKEVDFTEETKQQIVSSYSRVAERSLTNQGPQSIRIEQEELLSCLDDAETIYTTINIDGEIVPFPVFIPIRNMPGSFDESFHEERLGIKKDQDDFNGIFFFAGTEEIISQIDSFNKDTLSSIRSVIVEYEDRDVELYEELKLKLSNGGILTQEDNFIDEKNGTPASLNHYIGRAYRAEDIEFNNEPNSRLIDVFNRDVNEGRIEKRPYNGASIVSPEEFAIDSKLQDDLWRFSEDQFNGLTENFPIIQEPDREEFVSILSDPGTTNVVYFYEGRPVTSCVFIENIDNCNWLRPDYFDDYFNEQQRAYFPYLATHPDFTSHGFASATVELLDDLVFRSGNPFNILFECTNVSNDSVPNLVETAIKLDGKLNVDLDMIAKYYIKSLKIVD